MGRSSTASSSSSLAPGFRFHPTDEELVLYYLKRKLINKRFRFDAISVVDVYKAEPWDLPSMSKLKTRDLEWYFFSVLDKKYGNKSRTNRATGRGYWKTTGKDRAVYHGSRVVGMKKTLVYHNGRAPRGERTNWVMHEYRLTDEEFFEHSGIPQDAFVLCRIFEKSGPGPKNGEKYGAPFIEEEWEDDEETYFPCEDVPEVDDLTSSDDGCLNIDELDKILDFDIASGSTPPPPQNFYYGESSKFVEAHSDVMNGDQEPIKETFEAANGLGARIKLYNIAEHPMNPVLKPDGPEESSKFLEAHSDIMKDDQEPIKDSFEAANGLGARVKLDNIPEHPMNPALVPDGPEDVDSFDIDCFLDEAFFDATENSTYEEGLYVEGTESSRLIDSIRADASDGVSMVEEYLSLFDTDGGSIQITGLDSSQALGTDNCIADQSSQSQKPLKESSIPNEHILKAYEGDGSSSPSKKSSKMENIKSVMSDPFIKKASHMLGNISSPSAFACEFPSKEAMLQLDSANAVHVAAGFIRVTNLATSGSETNWSATKSRDVKFVLSNGLSQGLGSASLIPFMDIISGRSGSSMPRGFWYCLFIWVLVISISFKVGTIIYAQ